ncbi:MAG: hypothetical protein GF333_02935 [Candidatus Omnitrophica bacterium]|nr:hypothetical protein [Candidatus Omnitrophota bacterium]
MWKSRNKIFLVSAFCLTAFTGAAQNIEVDARVDSARVRTGTPFAYRVTVKGTVRSPRVHPPEFSSFRVLGTAQNQSYSLRPGGTAQLTLRITYTLLAPQPGSYRIEPFAVENGGGTVKSNAVNIQVYGDPLKEKKRPLPLGSGTEI